jgi:hypothetical protein
MGTYAIIGRGASTPKEVIVAGLKDSLKEGDSVKVAWGSASMTADEGTLWDYLLDFEIPTVLLYEDGDTVVPILKGLEHVEIRKTRNKLASTVSDVDQVLLMWGEDRETEDMLMNAFNETGDGSTGSVTYLELTNGLEPIILVDEEDVLVPQESPSSEVVVEDSEPDEDRSFTKLELDTMTAHAVKRYGERIGATGTTKSAIIAELFPDRGTSIMGPGPRQADKVVKNALEAVGITDTPAPQVKESIIDEALKPLRDLLILLASASTATIEVLQDQGMLDEGTK